MDWGPNKAPVSVMLPAQLAKETGNKMVKMKRYMDAIPSYQSAIDHIQTPQNKEEKDIIVACYNNIALCYITLEEYEHALSALNIVIRTERANLKANYRFAKTCLALYEKLGLDHMLKNSIMAAEYTLKLAPDDEEVRAFHLKVQQKIAAVSGKEANKVTWMKQSEAKDQEIVRFIHQCLSRYTQERAMELFQQNKQEFNFKSHGSTLIYLSIYFKAPKFLRKVFEKVAKNPLPKPIEKMPDFLDKFGWEFFKTPHILLAAMFSDADTFRQLLKAGCSLKEVGVAGETRFNKAQFKANVLGAAAYHRNNEVLQEILPLVHQSQLEYTVKAETTDIKSMYAHEFSGYTPLFLAINSPHFPERTLDTVKLLVDAGARTDRISNQGLTIFHHTDGVAIDLRKEVVQFLLKSTHSVDVLQKMHAITGDPASNLRRLNDFENALLIEARIKELKEKPKKTSKPAEDPQSKPEQTQGQSTQEAATTSSHANKSTCTTQVTTSDQSCQADRESLHKIEMEKYKKLYEAKLKEIEKVRWEMELADANFQVERAELNEKNLQLELSSALAQQEQRKIEKTLDKTMKKLEREKANRRAEPQEQ